MPPTRGPCSTQQLVRPMHRPLRIEGDGRPRFIVDPTKRACRSTSRRWWTRRSALSRAGGFGDRVMRELRGRRLHESVPLRAGSLAAARSQTFVADVASNVDLPAEAARVLIPLADAASDRAIA